MSDLIERWENDCGLDIVYNGIRLGYERHMVRELHEQLTEQIAKWDVANDLGKNDLARFEWLIKYVNAPREEIDKRMKWEIDNARLRAADKTGDA
jgi:hypothetical protein